MRTSHVGSYPLPHTPPNFRRALVDTLRAEITVPPIPQLRSFIRIYLDPLLRSGALRARGDLYELKDLKQIGYGHPRSAAEIEEFSLFLELANDLEIDLKEVRVPVTGPFTLASVIAYEGGSGIADTLLARREDLLEHLVPYVSSIVDAVDSMGFGYVFIDEPVLGLLVRDEVKLGYKEVDIVDSLTEILDGIGAQVGMHVCGSLSGRLVKLMMRLPITYLSLELRDTPENMRNVDPEDLEESGKILSPGVVSSKNPSVEGVEEVSRFLRQIVEKLGSERVDLVSADCGFAGFSHLGERGYEVAISKLRTMVMAVRLLERTLG